MTPLLFVLSSLTKGFTCIDKAFLFVTLVDLLNMCLCEILIPSKLSASIGETECAADGEFSQAVPF